MNIENLQFFDYNGYNLNFDWNYEYGYWEGSIYLPKVSVGLYANTSIYVLEYISNSSLNSEIFSNEYVFPYNSTGGKITFYWDKLNAFVDEFFMFNFDEDYHLKETSALVYTPNDGPDCNTLIINRFEEYEVPLENTYVSKPLPIHIAFMANEKYDATTYNRTLIMAYNGKTIARIKFYAETVEEDERLKIWNSNLGYNITPEDEMIFYKSDIKEYKPDYKFLNEKRKELMMEGSNIYPYIGSYKAIINAIKFFGYENLNIIEYWRNVNPDDENFGKIYHSSKYSLTKKETITIGSRNIVLPNKDYKKVNSLALVYSINEPTGEVDDWELPKVREKFSYTIEEAIIKLFALRKKLNKEFLPGNSRIIDIIGEANYFGINSIIKIDEIYSVPTFSKELTLDFEIEPSQYIHITDNVYFARYINLKNNVQNNLHNQMLSDISETPLSALSQLNSDLICNLYKDYYREAYVDYTMNKEIGDNDDYPYDNPEYDYYADYPTERFTAKVVIENTTFKDLTFDECELKFNCEKTTIFEKKNEKYDYNEIYGKTVNGVKTYCQKSILNPTFQNISTIISPNRISWTITKSTNQIDEDLKNIGIEKSFDDIHNGEQIASSNGFQDINEYKQFLAQLPYLGYYDVTMELGYSSDNDTVTNIQRKTKKKCIKVEPYNIELIGFYYDARELPTNLKYDQNQTLNEFIQTSIEKMSGWAEAERIGQSQGTAELTDDETMPAYSIDGTTIIPGPYYNDNMVDEWYLSDNITFEISRLKPLAKYARYIKNGVDVKPYTWFLLGFEYSKIAGKVNPYWYVINNQTGKTILERPNKKYLTLLLKSEGNYTVKLILEDKCGNNYEISRNIIVVNKSANYNIYKTFKEDYDIMMEERMLKQLNEYYADDKEDLS